MENYKQEESEKERRTTKYPDNIKSDTMHKRTENCWTRIRSVSSA